MTPKLTGFNLLATGALLAGATLAWAAPPTPYVGQQTRDVTSLSEAEVADLLAGKGMGLAKPAELNGYPGPMHVLELADQLQLTAVQRTAVQASFDKMAARAKQAGASYVAAERALDDAFRSGKADAATIEARLADAEKARAEKRMAHIAAHLEITPLLSAGQRQRYAELRGYTGAGGTKSGHGSGAGSGSGSGVHVKPNTP
jgi:Spy/CpxP family protein refolding chaperone